MRERKGFEMTKKQKPGKAKDNLWRVLISAVGVALIVLSLSRTALYFFGETAPASFSARRVGGADDDKPPSQRYEWSVSYTFTDKNDRQHNGVSTRRGSDSSVKTGDRVAYFPAAPFISAIADETEPDGGKLLLAGLGALLIWVMNQKKKRNHYMTEIHQTDQTSPHVELTDYDDSVEEIFHGDMEQ